ncbi:MAG: DUF1566 domain-containing protein [Proteobacteria bacterium]|nr:DUF1566 domain-containing protein [Pseudomonadota bacterium]
MWITFLKFTVLGIAFCLINQGCKKINEAEDNPNESDANSADVDADADTDTDTDSESGSDTDTDIDIDSDSDSDADTDTDIDVDGNTDSDTDIDGFCSTGWYDSSSILCWENPSQLIGHWSLAQKHCNKMGESWRLPTIDELRSLIRVEESGGECSANLPRGSCGVTDPDCLMYDCRKSCGSCPENDGPDNNSNGCYWSLPLEGPCTYYWSISPTPDLSDEHVWFLDFSDGELDAEAWDAEFAVRCVRTATLIID